MTCITIRRYNIQKYSMYERPTALPARCCISMNLKKINSLRAVPDLTELNPVRVKLKSIQAQESIAKKHASVPP